MAEERVELRSLATVPDRLAQLSTECDRIAAELGRPSAHVRQLALDAVSVDSQSRRLRGNVEAQAALLRSIRSRVPADQLAAFDARIAEADADAIAFRKLAQRAHALTVTADAARTAAACGR